MVVGATLAQPGCYDVAGVLLCLYALAACESGYQPIPVCILHHSSLCAECAGRGAQLILEPHAVDYADDLLYQLLRLLLS
jgi:hypothetical protein